MERLQRLCLVAALDPRLHTTNASHYSDDGVRVRGRRAHTSSDFFNPPACSFAQGRKPDSPPNSACNPAVRPASSRRPRFRRSIAPG